MDNQELSDLRDALDHIMRTARASRTQTRRLRWIAERARCALEGGDDWRAIQLPPSADSAAKEINALKAKVATLEKRLEPIASSAVRIQVGDYVCVLTCGACPEQYDVVDAKGAKVGYMRLRHGRFTVEAPYVGDTLVYEANPVGDGMFNDDERWTHLDQGVKAIDEFLKKAKE